MIELAVGGWLVVQNRSLETIVADPVTGTEAEIGDELLNRTLLTYYERHFGSINRINAKELLWHKDTEQGVFLFFDEEEGESWSIDVGTVCPAF